MYVMLGCCPLDVPPGSYRDTAASHLLGVVAEGQGRILISGQAYDLTAGCGVLIDHGTDYELLPAERLRLVWIAFDDLIETSSTERERHYYKRAGRFPLYGLLPARAMPSVADLARQIEALLAEPGERRRHRADMLLQELICQLLEMTAMAQVSTADSLERAADYIRTHHDKPLTRDRLAEAAGLSPWYFSHQFKRWLGVTPMEYVHQVRIRHAKELMILHRSGIREAGERSGYSDEAYFRKKFKQVVGITPADYRKNKLARIASLSYTYTSHLLTLGIVPLAATVDRERETHRQEAHASIAVHLRRAIFREDALFEEDFERLGSLQPSLIVGDDLMIQGETAVRLGDIAPCQVIPWLGLDWRGHFLQIARLVEREDEAAAWLDAYDHRARQARMALAETVGDASVLLLRICFGQLSVFGERNVGAVLHHDLGLRCPYDLASIAVEQTVSEPFVHHCRPDILLLSIDDSPASLSTWETLQEHPQWQSLPAIRDRRWYQIAAYPWLEYSPEAHRRTLEEVMSLLAKHHSPEQTAQLASE